MSTKPASKPAGKPVIAVEIGGDWLKVAQFEPSRRGVELTALHLQRFDSAGNELAAPLKDALSKGNFGRHQAVSFLPRQMVTIRMLELPSVEPAEIADMVDLQTGRQTPYSRDEIISDYRVLGTAREGYTRVMLAIVQRSVLRQRFSILEEAGLSIDNASVSTEGLLRWHAAAAGVEGTRAQLDVDSFYSDLSVIADGAVVFTRSILIGANQLLADYDAWQERFAREVQGSLEAFAGESPGVEVESLLLTGAGPNVEGLADDLNEFLPVSVEARDSASLLAAVPDAPSLKDPKYASVSLTAAIGMALEPRDLTFTLVPDTIRLRRGLLSKARSLTTLGILVMALLVALSLNAVSRFYVKQERLAGLRAELARMEPVVREVEKRRQIINVVRARANPRRSATLYLAELHRAVPEGVRFERIAFDAGARTLTLGGWGPSRTEVRALVQDLEDSPVFRDVEASNTERDPRTDQFRFQVVGTLEVGS